MKSELKKITVAVAITLCATAGYAQQPGQLLPPPPAPPHRPGMAPAPPVRPGAVTQLTTLDGKILEYTTNDRREYDGFTFQSSGSTLAIRFPAHLAAQLLKVAPAGSSVSLGGAQDETPEGPIFHLYSLRKGETVVSDNVPAALPDPATERTKDFKGNITELSHDRRGMINGLILSGKMLINLPPAAVGQLSQYLKPGISLSGTGVQRAKPAGVVTADNLDTVDARTLSVSGNTYLVR